MTCPNFFAERNELNSFSLSLDLHEMSLNIDMKIILPVKFSGVSFNLNSNSWTSWLSCNVVNPVKIFHSNSIGSPSILSKALYSGVLLKTAPNFASMLCLTEGSRVFYQDTIQNLKRRRPLCAEDWWLVQHQSKTILPWRIFPINCFSLQRSHLVRTPISEVCGTFVSLWGLSYSWWNANCLSNSFPWIPLIPIVQSWTFLKSHNVFRRFL